MMTTTKTAAMKRNACGGVSENNNESLHLCSVWVQTISDKRTAMTPVLRANHRRRRRTRRTRTCGDCEQSVRTIRNYRGRSDTIDETPVSTIGALLWVSRSPKSRAVCLQQSLSWSGQVLAFGRWGVGCCERRREREETHTVVVGC